MSDEEALAMIVAAFENMEKRIAALDARLDSAAEK